MPNQEQLKAILQMLLGTGGPLAALILSYGVPPDKLNLWVNLIVAVAPPLIAGLWAILDNTHKNTLAAASAVPGVTQIRVADNANGGAEAAMKDTSLPKVVPASAPAA